MKIFKRLQFKAGFSLMEILVVLFIVSSAMMGVVSLIVQNIQVQSVNKNNLIASSLAQEGLELIRQVRDNNWRNSLPFNTNLADGSYQMDYRISTPIPIDSNSAAQLYLKDGFYVTDNTGSETGLTSTIFSRQIITKEYPSYPGDPIEVRSIVSWVDHTHPYRYELQTLLFDWR